MPSERSCLGHPYGALSRIVARIRPRTPIRPPLSRRSSRTLAATLTLAFATALGAAAGGGSAATPRTPAATPLRVQVGQLIATGFPGTSAPAWMRERLSKRELGGV